MNDPVGRNDPCPCGSGKKFKRCCLDATSDRATNTPEAKLADLTVLVDTESGLMARRVPPASRLDGGPGQGAAAERATQDAAAVWGLPDFMYRPVYQSVGSGTREVGDGIVIVSGLGIVLQVKSRAAPSADVEKERRWLHKQIAQAMSQGSGTIRRLRQQPAALTNLRGRTLDIDGKDYRWMTVVVVDHPDPPDGCTPVLSAKHPSVVLLRRDWEFLFDQLKSTTAVAYYCERVAADPIELGTEPARYYDLALADANAEPQSLDPALLAAGGQPVSTPLLPLAPAASDDRGAHELVRTIFEDIAITNLMTSSETDRLRVLGELDRLPVGVHTEIGRNIRDAKTEMLQADPDHMFWRLKILRGPAGQAHLAFGACSRPHSTEIQELFSWWVQLRHHDALVARKDLEHLTTVGVLLTPRNDKRRPWDTTMSAVSGDPGFSAEELEALRTVWPSTPGEEALPS
jgi:hypothetical protein